MHPTYHEIFKRTPPYKQQINFKEETGVRLEAKHL